MAVLKALNSINILVAVYEGKLVMLVALVPWIFIAVALFIKKEKG